MRSKVSLRPSVASSTPDYAQPHFVTMRRHRCEDGGGGGTGVRVGGGGGTGVRVGGEEAQV